MTKSEWKHFAWWTVRRLGLKRSDLDLAIFLLLVIVFFWLAGSAHSQEAVQTQTQIATSKRPKTLIVLSLLQLGAAGADAYYTNRNFNRPGYGYEGNPIARPFTGTTAGRIGYFSASAGLHIGGAWLLRKHHHNKLADGLLLEGIGDHTIGAVHNATH